MCVPLFFVPFINLICNRKSVLRKTGLTFFALHTRACARVCASHHMSQSPNNEINKKIEMLMWDNLGRVRSGTSFAIVMEVSHG